MASILDFRALKSSENMTPLFLRIFIVSFNKIYSYFAFIKKMTRYLFSWQMNLYCLIIEVSGCYNEIKV